VQCMLRKPMLLRELRVVGCSLSNSARREDGELVAGDGFDARGRYMLGG
jgi:hypothetical protein